MNISDVGQQISGLLSKSNNLFFKAGDNFSRELTLGQIIKGKVLRSLDGGSRYQVEFAGQQKVVDSTIPLKVGELIHGRVVNVGDQVEIKRLTVNSEQNSLQNNAAFKNDLGLSLTNKWDMLLIQTMRESQVKFNAQQRSDIIKVMKQADNPQLVLLSAVALTKQKIGLDQETLQLLNKLQSKQEKLSLFAVEQLAPELVTQENSSEMKASQENLQLLTAALVQLIKEQEEKARQINSDVSQTDELTSEINSKTAQQKGLQDKENKGESFNLNQSFSNIWRLLNNQVDGSVQHRVSTLPFWVGERVVEVDVVMYEQHQNRRQITEIDNRKIVFSLELEQLGNVEVEMLLNNRHVKMSISTDKAEHTQMLLAHGVELSESVNEQSWLLDEMSYVTKNKDEMGNVVSSVLEHYASQDSLSRLM